MLLVAGFAGLVLLKIPGVLQGRLWAEDGLFLLDAMQLPWWQALITPHTGYVDVVASGAMLIAINTTDWEHVALMSVGMALAIQLCPAVLLVTSKCAWLRPRWALMVALLLVLTPPVAEEIWLSPVTSQYHLMVCTGLILALEVQGGAIGGLQLVLLILAGLSGPGPVLVAPLFVMRAIVDRSSPRTVQASVLSIAALIEIAVFCAHPVADRHLGISTPLLLSVIYVKHLLVPFLGPFIAAGLAGSFAHDFKAGAWPLLPVILASIALGGLAIAAMKTRGRDVRWLCAGALTMMVFSYFGALGGQENLLNIYFGGRYYYAPQVLVSLTLLGLARTAPAILQWPALALVGWLLLAGIQNYREVRSEMAEGPSWRDQIAHWRSDPNKAIALWPPTFQIRLDRLSDAPSALARSFALTTNEAGSWP